MAQSQRSIDSLKLARVLNIERDRVWDFIAHDQQREQWWPQTTFELVPGGSLRSTFHNDGAQTPDTTTLSGEVDVVITGHALGFSWRRAGDPWATTALITLASLSGITQVSVVELGFMGYHDEEARIRESFAAWDERLSALEALVRASPAPAAHSIQKA